MGSQEIRGQFFCADCFRIGMASAKEEKGITELEEQIKEMFFGGEISFNDEVYITNARHKAALDFNFHPQIPPTTI